MGAGASMSDRTRQHTSTIIREVLRVAAEGESIRLRTFEDAAATVGSTDVDHVRTLFASMVDPSSGAASGEIEKIVKYADVANLCALLDAPGSVHSHPAGRPLNHGNYNADSSVAAIAAVNSEDEHHGAGWTCKDQVHEIAMDSNKTCADACSCDCGVGSSSSVAHGDNQRVSWRAHEVEEARDSAKGHSCNNFGDSAGNSGTLHELDFDMTDSDTDGEGLTRPARRISRQGDPRMQSAMCGNGGAGNSGDRKLYGALGADMRSMRIMDDGNDGFASDDEPTLPWSQDEAKQDQQGANVEVRFAEDVEREYSVVRSLGAGSFGRVMLVIRQGHKQPSSFRGSGGKRQVGAEETDLEGKDSVDDDSRSHGSNNTNGGQIDAVQLGRDDDYHRVFNSPGLSDASDDAPAGTCRTHASSAADVEEVLRKFGIMLNPSVTSSRCAVKVVPVMAVAQVRHLQRFEVQARQEKQQQAAEENCMIVAAAQVVQPRKSEQGGFIGAAKLTGGAGASNSQHSNSGSDSETAAKSRGRRGIRCSKSGRYIPMMGGSGAQMRHNAGGPNASQAGTIVRAVKEAEVLSRLRHPCIVSFYEAFIMTGNTQSSHNRGSSRDVGPKEEMVRRVTTESHAGHNASMVALNADVYPQLTPCASPLHENQSAASAHARAESTAANAMTSPGHDIDLNGLPKANVVVSPAQSYELWIAMEFCSGGDLAQQMRQDRDHRRQKVLKIAEVKGQAAAKDQIHVDAQEEKDCDEDDEADEHEKIVLRVLVQLLLALRYLHGLRPIILHRDLKPANVLLLPPPVVLRSPAASTSDTISSSSGMTTSRHTTTTTTTTSSSSSSSSDGNSKCPRLSCSLVKLADFGLARALDSTQAMAMTEVGTPTYLAPEVIRSDIGYNSKSDIWGVGVIGYELLWQHHPFTPPPPPPPPPPPSEPRPNPQKPALPIMFSGAEEKAESGDDAADLATATSHQIPQVAAFVNRQGVAAGNGSSSSGSSGSSSRGTGQAGVCTGGGGLLGVLESVLYHSPYNHYSVNTSAGGTGTASAVPHYSSDLQQLISDCPRVGLLQKEQSQRPSAEDVLRMPLFKAPLSALQLEMEQVLLNHGGMYNPPSAAQQGSVGVGAATSVDTYEFLSQAAMIVVECREVLRVLHGASVIPQLG